MYTKETKLKSIKITGFDADDKYIKTSMNFVKKGNLQAMLVLVLHNQLVLNEKIKSIQRALKIK